MCGFVQTFERCVKMARYNLNIPVRRIDKLILQSMHCITCLNLKNDYKCNVDIAYS